LNRKVYAWKTGMFFTGNPAQPKYSSKTPTGKPIYMLPNGGAGVKACEFTPNAAQEPGNCGGLNWP
jgi:hypothetical protein